MSRENISFEVARYALRLVAEGGSPDALDALGVSIDDLQFVRSDNPFLASDRNRVTSVLQSLCHGSLDLIGLPRIEIPAEYVAAILVTFVRPGNLMVACRWCESGPPAAEAVGGGLTDAASAKQLFAACCQLAGEAPAARAAWEKRTRRAVRIVKDEGVA